MFSNIKYITVNSHNRYNALFLSLIVFYVTILTASIISYIPSKVIVIFSLLPTVAIFNFKKYNFSIIPFTLLTITFPVTLTFFEKDAFSTGTLIIFLTLALSLLKNDITDTLAKNKLIFGFFFLITITAIIGILTKAESTYLGRSARHFVNLISSFSVFILIIHSQNIKGITSSNKEYIDKLINTLMFIIVIHIFLSFLILTTPWIEDYLSLFLYNNQESFGKFIENGFYDRATSVFTNGEEFGELIILSFPFAIYKFFSSQKIIFLFVTLSLVIGLIISGTRSSFFLIILQFITFVYIIIPKKYNIKKIWITLFFLFSFIVLSPFLLQFTPILKDRINITIDNIRHNEDILTITNRAAVWPLAYELTKNTISSFGHGPIQAHELGFPVKNFHNLYLSLLFQFGIFGSFVFLLFFFFIIRKLFVCLKYCSNKDQSYLLILACLFSLFSFLVNEFKFEFNRSDSYQQFVWCFFSIFYLSGTTLKNIK